MREFGKALGRVLLVMLLAVAAIWGLAPREPVLAGPFAKVTLPDDLDAFLSAAEAAVPGITPGAEKQVVWAGAPGARTPVAIVYLHGYSATHREISPVTEDVAARLGTNVYFARLTGHGLPGAALARATADDWLRDTAEAIAIGRRLGDKVVVIGTSTGATFAVLEAARVPVDAADAYVFISPNFRIRAATAGLLTLPMARVWVPWVAGDTRSWTPHNELHGRFWTSSYPTVGLIPMAAAVQALEQADVATLNAPVLAVFSDADQVVDAAATRALLARWGGTVTIVNPDLAPGSDPNAHVIAGDIMSPGMTQGMVNEIAGFISGL